MGRGRAAWDYLHQEYKLHSEVDFRKALSQFKVSPNADPRTEIMRFERMCSRVKGLSDAEKTDNLLGIIPREHNDIVTSIEAQRVRDGKLDYDKVKTLYLKLVGKREMRNADHKHGGAALLQLPPKTRGLQPIMIVTLRGSHAVNILRTIVR